MRSGRWKIGIAAALMVCALAACTRSVPAPVVDKGTGGATAAGSPKQARSAVVQAGENLYATARRHGVSVRALISANGLKPPFILRVGQRLKLPVPNTHVVVGGDTVYGISRRYGVDMASLMRANRLKPPYTIQVGQRLRLPGGSQLAAVEPRKTVKPKAGSKTTPLPKRKAAPPKKNRAVAKAIPPRSNGRFAWPVKGPILSSFGAKAGGLYNDGINISAKKGAPMKAAENGIVAYAGNELRGFGNLVLIRHRGGWMTAYAHADRILVKRGDTVKRGQMIGRAGSSGSVTRPQVHFEIRKGSQAVDPIKYLTAGSRETRVIKVVEIGPLRQPI